MVSILLSWQKVCFVATNLCLSQQNYCYDKMILVVVAAPANDRCHAISNSTFQCWPTSACLHSHRFGFLAPIPAPTPHPTNHFSSVSPGFDSWCFFFAGLWRWLWGWWWAERGMSRDIWHFLSVLPFREHSGVYEWRCLTLFISLAAQRTQWSVWVEMLDTFYQPCRSENLAECRESGQSLIGEWCVLMKYWNVAS